MLGTKIDLGIILEIIQEYIYTEDTLKVAAIVMFFIWLIYRIRYRTRRFVHKEVYNEVFKNFPRIRKEIDNFEYRIKYLNNRLNDVENKIIELARRAER